MAWYIGSSAVEKRVFVIDDADVVKSVEAQSGIADEKTALLDGELKVLIEKWEDASKQSDEARDVARVAYDSKLAELEQYKKATAVTTQIDAMKDKSWYADLEQYRAEQKQWQLERINKRRASSSLEAKELADISVGYGGMVSDGKIYIYHPDVEGLVFSVQLLVCVAFVTVAWVVTTLVTAPADKKTLRSFYKLCHPGGPGWRKVVEQARADGEEIDQKNAIGDWKLPIQILCVFLGCITIYSSLFSVGNVAYGNQAWGFVLIGVAAVSVFALFKCFGKIGVEASSD